MTSGLTFHIPWVTSGSGRGAHTQIRGRAPQSAFFANIGMVFELPPRLCLSSPRHQDRSSSGRETTGSSRKGEARASGMCPWLQGLGPSSRALLLCRPALERSGTPEVPPRPQGARQGQLAWHQPVFRPIADANPGTLRSAQGGTASLGAGPQACMKRPCVCSGCQILGLSSCRQGLRARSLCFKLEALACVEIGQDRALGSNRHLLCRSLAMHRSIS